MTAHPQPTRWRCSVLLAVLGGAVPCGHAAAQTPPPNAPDLWQKPVLGRDLVSAIWKGDPAPSPTPTGRSARFRMFGMVPGFINDPLGLDSDDDPKVSDDPFARAGLGQGDSARGGLPLSMGNDNPSFA